MARFVAGDVVILPFPYTNQSGGKKRPAVVLRETRDNDLWVCMITSAAFGSDTIPLDKKNLESSGLRVACAVRPDRILVVSPDLVEKKTGRLSKEMLGAIKAVLVNWLQS
jgi:mRNA interferase MazF